MSYMQMPGVRVPASEQRTYPDVCLFREDHQECTGVGKAEGGRRWAGPVAQSLQATAGTLPFSVFF